MGTSVQFEKGWGQGLKRQVSDTDGIRQQNRSLVLAALRHNGPLPRTELAARTGLSNATISAIAGDMVGQCILRDLNEAPPATPPKNAVPATARSRGRPRIHLGFNRNAGHALIVEIDVSKIRVSMIDYGGVLVDRVETAITPGQFEQSPPIGFLRQRLDHVRDRNPAEARRLMHIAISVQGILDRQAQSLVWSPVPHLAGHRIVEGLQRAYGLPVALYKRGQLLAEGTRLLYPDLEGASVATIFVGATVAMGITVQRATLARRHDAGTEFGHMNHIPNGALCRCGMAGCIEAYAADYGVLRTAFSVPGKTIPAKSVPAEHYSALIASARRGERHAVHAFNTAGSAIGFGLNRLMSVFDPSHVIIVGPGANAFDLMRSELENGLASSLVCKVSGLPQILTHFDESEPIFRGLVMKALGQLDHTVFAPLPTPPIQADTP